MRPSAPDLRLLAERTRRLAARSVGFGLVLVLAFVFAVLEGARRIRSLRSRPALTSWSSSSTPAANPRRALPALSTLLVLLCAGLACTSPPRRAVTIPEGLPVDGPTAEVDGVVAHAVITPMPAEQAATPPEDLGPLMLRVGLATDLSTVQLPCCDRRFRLVLDDEREVALDRPTTIEPAAGIEQTAIYRLQVAALKDEVQAQGIADYLNSETDYPSESVFDADTDLYRVRVGRFATRAAAEEARGGLAGLGVTEGWIVSEGGELESPAFVVRRGDQVARREGRWLEVRVEGDGGVPYERSRYRGQILYFLNDRGLVNVINELPLEEYLRGVVPKEMGPELYDELEALKAQTVAARTYTLRNLGEFAGEGYDICSTPRCQVYGGMNDEHPFSDQAITQTSGQVVLFDGQPAETFYSATCGGHTENVEVVFPLKRGDYLRGVPCLEAGVTTVQGDLGAGTTFPAGLIEQILPAATGSALDELAARLEHLALLADLPVPVDRLGSLERSEVLRYVTSLYDLHIDRRLLGSTRGVERLLREPPADWTLRERRFARYLVDSRLLERSSDAITPVDATELLMELAYYLGVLREDEVHFLEIDEGALHVRADGDRPAYPLPGDFSTFRRRGDVLVGRPLDLMAGDRLVVYFVRDRVVSLVQPVDAPAVELGRRAPRQKWTLWKSDDEVRRAVQKRYPGFPFTDFEILERGVSGRVGKLALLAGDGRRIVVEGLAVRWTLDVPDTLFVAERRTNGDRSGWLFRGRGWGHGVGMSQAGAFGMAVRGATYREILEHYYTGIDLGRLKPAPPRPRLPAS